MEICTITLDKDRITEWSYTKNNVIYTEEVITTPFKFLLLLTRIVLFILIICPVHWRVWTPQWLFMGWEFWEQCHSAAQCQVPNLLLLQWRAGTRWRFSCGQSVNFRGSGPIKCWIFFPHFYREIIPKAANEISRSYIINASRCLDLGNQTSFL